MRDAYDPKGLISEAYEIDGIGLPECRSIFLDWALSHDGDPSVALARLIARHADPEPGHPMSQVLREALGTAPTGRRGGRRGRVGDDPS
ncbi:hypothetical protein [Jannaschia sp. LMIT008]|uniref:hypothetical protein n=1 Tax=Jannaschia maritima TaxID=3032585 RepID=UPI002810F66A|nr:hypothetical protein [Jannaschia sp. LMIT008]